MKITMEKFLPIHQSIYYYTRNDRSLYWNIVLKISGDLREILTSICRENDKQEHRFLCSCFEKGFEKSRSSRHLFHHVFVMPLLQTWKCNEGCLPKCRQIQNFLIAKHDHRRPKLTLLCHPCLNASDIIRRIGHRAILIAYDQAIVIDHQAAWRNVPANHCLPTKK